VIVIPKHANSSSGATSRGSKSPAARSVEYAPRATIVDPPKASSATPTGSRSCVTRMLTAIITVASMIGTHIEPKNAVASTRDGARPHIRI